MYVLNVFIGTWSVGFEFVKVCVRSDGESVGKHVIHDRREDDVGGGGGEERLRDRSNCESSTT
jgi:hypothetical protein